MAKTKFDITVSLDGFVAGPNQSRETPLGEGGEELHDWGIATATFQELHGRSGGETGTDSDVFAEMFESCGAVMMGRNMFGGGTGPWGSDPSFDDPWNGWWGEDPPFHMPVFVLTHHEREPLTLSDTTFTFVTDGVEAAHQQAREAADGKDVLVAGGGQAIQQALRAGLIDEFQLHVVPLMLGDGARLFEDHLPAGGLEVERTRVIDSPAVTHLSYRVKN
jgi:dihydrofolate reductase